jgi:hypothetical protein
VLLWLRSSKNLIADFFNRDSAPKSLDFAQKPIPVAEHPKSISATTEAKTSGLLQVSRFPTLPLNFTVSGGFHAQKSAFRRF